MQDVTDPRGIVTRTVHDLLGRTTASILNYTGGAPGAQSDVTTTFQFDTAGRLASRTAVQPSGTPSQVTGYVYGVSPATGSAMASYDVIATTKYPDRVTGLPSSTDVETYTVNALGERIGFTDRAGSTHAYTRNVVGRQTADTVVALGSGVNGDIRRIEATYETLGQMASTTSFDAATGGTAKNQVARVFAGFGKIASEAQAHTGLVDSATPKVQYQWSQGVGGNFDRLDKTVYPDGFEVTVAYTGIDSAMSRITSLSGAKASDGTAVVLESQKYLGASTVIDRSRPEVNVNLTLVNPSGTAGSAGDKYTGLDRFGRVVDQKWVQGLGTSAPVVDRIGYTFDRNGNRLTATNALNAAFNETYTHDALNQIQSFARGSTSSPSATQAWQFDALGNWTTLTTNGVAESRTANAQNELTNVGAAALTYSATGNLTTDATGRLLEYDAWNRLVKVTSADTLTWTAYTYNGLNHRVTDTFGPGPVTTTRDIYYSLQWQALEERVRDGSGAIPTVADTRYVWSPVYVDAMVARDRNADSSGTTGTGGLEERVYALQDSNWNTTAIIAASGVTGFTTGAVINRFVYSPFGVSQTLTASWATPTSAPATVWTHLFQGLTVSETTGLAYVRNRDYSASLGRFIATDLLGFDAGDSNLYRFVSNRPFVYVDPTGLNKCTTAFYEPKKVAGFGFALRISGFDFGFSADISQRFGSYAVCPICCEGGVPGSHVSVTYSASVDVTAWAAKTWTWVGLGLGLIRGHLTVGLTANGHGDLSFVYLHNFCGMAPFGEAKVCSNQPFWLTIAVGAVVNTNVASAWASAIGAVHIPAIACATLSVATGAVSNPTISLTGAPAIGRITLSYGALGMANIWDRVLL